MRTKLKSSPAGRTSLKWFAWHPIRLYDKTEHKFQWVWLEIVNRIWQSGCGWGFGHWTYNEISKI